MTIYKRNCNTCGKYYEGQGKKYCCYGCRPIWNKDRVGVMPTPWNKGLTKETSEILKESGKKIKKSSIGRKSWMIGLTNETDSRIKRMHDGKRIKLSDGTLYPRIPNICYCMRLSCYEICWYGNYKQGHQHCNNHYVKGMPKSEEHKRKERESHIGKKASLETRLKQSKSSNPKNSGRFKKGDPKLIKHAKDHQEKIKSNPELHPNRIMAKKGYITKPQKKLFELLKLIYFDAELEYPIKTLKTVRFADIGIPSLKLDFEYDGIYWHNQEKDEIRQKEIEEVGWKVIRITDKEKLSIELVNLKIKELNI